MEKETFTMRKNFLENHFKKKIVFYIVDEENNTHTSSITYKSNTLNCEYYNKHFVNRTRVLRLENFPESTFLETFDFLHILYVEEHDFILHPTKNFNFWIKCKTCKKKNIINLPKCFKSDECVICLSNQPDVLFCNCGHIPICTECSKIKRFIECPVCKTRNEIVRILE